MSSSTPRRQSSGSEGGLGIGIDVRKRKRVLSNRESARRSRMRKQQHLNDLINQAAQLKNENSNIAKQIDMITQRYSSVEADNVILKSQMMELKEKLEGLNSVLYIFQEGHGMALEIPEIPEHLLEQMPYPSVLIPASASEYFPTFN